MRSRYRFRPETILYYSWINCRRFGYKNNFIPPIIQVTTTLLFCATGAFYITVKRCKQNNESQPRSANLDSDRGDVMAKALQNMYVYDMYYIGGFVVHKLLKRSSCEENTSLLKKLVSEDPFDPKNTPGCKIVRWTNQHFGRCKSPISPNGITFSVTNDWLQMVCDAKRLITNCVASWPGATHDSRIFNQSHLCCMFEEDEIDLNTSLTTRS